MKYLLLLYLLLLLQRKCNRAGRVLDAAIPCLCFLEEVPDEHSFQRCRYIPFQGKQEQRSGRSQWKTCDLEFLGVDFLRFLSLINHLEESLSDV